MQVASLKQTSPEHITVLLSDGGDVRSTLSVITELRLFPGKALDADTLSELRLLSRRALSRERALAIVSRRPHSCKELRDKLVQKGVSEADADYCVAWLCEHGFLDDARYAAQLVRHYAGKNYGAGRIRAELNRRGIARELWDEAFTELPETDDKLDRFLAARLKDAGDPSQVQKVSNALFRRGYSWEQIRGALRRYCDAIEEEST